MGAPATEKKVRTKDTAGLAAARKATTMTSSEWKELQKGMKAKWPQPEYMAEPGRGGHNTYRDETYEEITRWTATTKISYRPHAKAPGTKSHVRYEAYAKAKTVGQALEMGSWPADWCWDWERGFIKVVGGAKREEPLDISQVQDESKLTEVDMAIHRWYKRELAKKHGLNIDDLLVSKDGGESLIMRVHRLVAQRNAKARLEAASRADRPISEDEVYQTLTEWAFARNPNRVNVQPDGQDWVWSDTLGLVRDRLGDIHLTKPTKSYPEVTMLINKYLFDRLPAEARTFKWTSLNLNCNYAAKLHRDGNNFGPSMIKAFGEFSGGELNYWPEDDRATDKLERLKQKDKVQLDLKGGLALFNGNSGHSVQDFEGSRYSIVYFTIGAYDKAPQEAKDGLGDLGFRLPASDEDPRALLRAPRGYGSKCCGDGGSPAWRYWKASKVDAAAAKLTAKWTPVLGKAAARAGTPGQQLRKRPASSATTGPGKRARAS
mmetsp:Transcript_23759/g.59960  ORF Transcript_23759/g.59960 Transcript_23759/m.59960 type:complete len:490 (+) Transcript_23759:65-1534(+)